MDEILLFLKIYFKFFWEIQLFVASDNTKCSGLCSDSRKMDTDIQRPYNWGCSLQCFPYITQLKIYKNWGKEKKSIVWFS